MTGLNKEVFIFVVDGLGDFFAFGIALGLICFIIGFFWKSKRRFLRNFVFYFALCFGILGGLVHAIEGKI